MKSCYICKEEKPESEYYLANTATGRLRPYCKPCDNKVAKDWKKRTGFIRSDSFKSWRKRNGYDSYAYRKEILKKYNRVHKEKVVARKAVHIALVSGRLTKLPCEVCGETKVQAHHANGYDKANQLNIKWLCQEHHRQAHYD